MYSLSEIIDVNKKKFIQKNSELLLHQIQTQNKKLLLKIKNYNHKYDTNITLSNIFENKFLQYFFMPDYVKQNIFELSQIEFLSQFYSIHKLPTTGKKSISLSTLTNISHSYIKTIDAIITINNTPIYVFLKFINQPGGGQTNQFVDCQLFIDEIKSYPNIFVTLCLDGEFFKNKKLLSEKNIFITNSNDLYLHPLSISNYFFS